MTRRSGSESPGSSPRRKGRGRRCNEDCDKTRSEQNQRVANLEKEKLNLKQQLNTVETHQKTLRSTISSKENLIQTQTQLVADHLKTISSQKQLIANLELTVSTHSDLAASFLDVIVSDDEGESDCEKNETHVFEKMHEKIKSLEERVRSDAIVVQNLEGAKEAVELSVSQLKEKLESKVKEYNGLKSHLSVVEETTLAREREIKDLKHDAVERQGTVESITISNSNLRGRIAELEKLRRFDPVGNFLLNFFLREYMLAECHRIRGYGPRFPDFGFSCVCVQNVWKMTKNAYFQRKTIDLREASLRLYRFFSYANM